MTYTTAVKITLGAVAHEELESIFGFFQKNVDYNHRHE
jgi:hypothetical protein